MNAQTRHSRQSAIRVRAGSFSFCILRNNCGPAYGRDIIDRPARPCGFGRMFSNQIRALASKLEAIKSAKKEARRMK